MTRSTSAGMLLMVALAVAGCGSVASGQDEPTPLPGCPEGALCLLAHEWPEFTMVYETRGGPITVLPAGNVYHPRQTKRLEYRDKYDWTLTVIASETVPYDDDDGEDATGSWRRQSGTTYTTYSAVTGETIERELKPREAIAPDIFTEAFFAGFDLATRQDGQEVATEVDVCTGDACHQVPQGAAGATSHATGQTFPNDPYLDDLTYTNDAWSIPIAGMGYNVLSLEIQPTDPDPSACQTNLRGLIVEERLDNQMLDTSCSSEHRSGSDSHYYTFSLDGNQQVDVRAESDSDDLYLYLLAGSNRDGTILEENDDLPSGQAQGASRTHVSGISRTLPAGTYTVEVATDAATPASGNFMLIVEAPVPDTTADAVQLPTPTPTPTPTPAPEIESDPCVTNLGALTENLTVDGQWTGSGAPVLWWEADTSCAGFGNSYARFYTFTLPNAGELRINTSSTENTLLNLRFGANKTGGLLAVDHTFVPKPQIVHNAIAAVYTLEVASHPLYRTGSFSLTIQPPL